MRHDHVASSLQKHPLYSDFIQVKNRLSAKGLSCWIAGGAVRDFLLDRTPFDFDLVTDATTEQILELFSESIPVGIQFGVVKIPVSSGQSFDLATFRREADYVDGRRPSRVDYATAEEDSLRRDFTINALFWDDEAKKVIDFVGGMKDLDQKCLRAVGDPTIRFVEDYLRVLRLLRFKTQLQFRIDPATATAARLQISHLKKISGERIWAEISKMIPAIQWENFFNDLFTWEVFCQIFPLGQRPHAANIKSSASSWVQFFYVLYINATSFAELRHALIDSLRVAKKEIKILDTIYFCVTHKYSVEEWVLEAEKNGHVIDTLRFLVEVKRFDGDVAAIAKLYLEKPEPLVDGNDLLGLVKSYEIGEALKKLRLLQLKQPTLDKLSLLKKLV